VVRSRCSKARRDKLVKRKNDIFFLNYMGLSILQKFQLILIPKDYLQAI
jgi:hypothetical protein